MGDLWHKANVTYIDINHGGGGGGGGGGGSWDDDDDDDDDDIRMNQIIIRTNIHK